MGDPALVFSQSTNMGGNQDDQRSAYYCPGGGSDIAPLHGPGRQLPRKSITFICPYSAGGGGDTASRMIAKLAGDMMGVKINVENKTGGGATIGIGAVAKSKPDGYTVAWNSTSILTTTNIGNVPFDYTALDNIGQVAQQPVPFVVSKNARWNSLKDFMDECKAKPNTLKVAFAGFGSATHLTGVALTNLSGCKAIMLPVKGPDRRKMILSGETDAAVDIFSYR